MILSTANIAAPQNLFAAAKDRARSGVSTSRYPAGA